MYTGKRAGKQISGGGDNAKEPVNYLKNAEKNYTGIPKEVLEEPGGHYGSEARTSSAFCGKYTVEDYFCLPAERGRCELIDGVIYDMASPTAQHQGLCLRVAAALLQFVDENGGDCSVFAAPLDVVLDPADDHTVVQPDVLVVCDPAKLAKGYVEGAPDLVIEILSPSTRRRDLTLKHRKYAAAGVREYWIIDVEASSIILYDFENGGLPKVCGFNTPVPVGIWGGRCVVDLAQIMQKQGRKV